MPARLMTLLLVGVISGPVAAQAAGSSSWDVAAGYAFLHDRDTSENLARGWTASLTTHRTSWLGLVGEADGSYKTLAIPGDPPKLRVYSLLGGPRITTGGTPLFTPFGQVLVGAARASSSVLGVGDTETDFAWQPGAGIDVNLSRHSGVRLEGDYRIIRAHEDNSKQFRFIAAAVWKFGAPAKD